MNWVSLSYKNIYRNKRRSLLTIFSIGVVAFVMTFQDAIVKGMQDDATQNIKELKTGDFYIQNKDLEKYQIFNPLSLLTDPQIVGSLLQKYQNIKIIENMDFAVSIFDSRDQMQFAKAAAYSMKFQEEKLRAGRSVYRLYQDKGKLPQGETEVAVALNLANKNNIKIGDRISVLTQTASRSLNGVSFTVTGIIYFSMASLNNDLLVFDIPAAQKLLKTREVNRILVETTNDTQAREIIEDIQPKLKDRYIVQHWSDSPDAAFIKIQDTIMKIVNIVFFVIGGSIIINTSIMNILERRKEIGMMSSLGARVGEIRLLFFLEAIWLGFIGTILGIILAAILASILGHTGWDFLGDAVSKETGLAISTTIYPRVALSGILRIFSFGMIISAVISYLPTGRVAKISPAEAFRN